jgi:hypothetical protein
MMPSPTLTFSVLLATFVGALMHAILGGNGRRLVMVLLTAWIGFALGQAVGSLLNINALAIGPINTLAGVMGSVVAVIAAVVLSSDRVLRGQRRS